MVNVSRHDDLDALVTTAATRLTELLSSIHNAPDGGVHGDGRARIVLTGGGSGIALLNALVERDIDWSRVEVFFGDERNVPVSDAESNEGQARDALLDKISIPTDNIHGYGLDGGDMTDQVLAYERTIDDVAPRGFDVHLLGMGGEGHINSLFPHTSAVAENERLVVAVTDSPKPPAERATLTLAAVTRADHVWLLVSGAEKAEAAAKVAHGADARDWPAAGAIGRVETVLFVTDDATTHID
ncbi:6-phosphogluconolactonase [Corynebacterium sp.]|uniref:6-phosphogluconolactonase n=1 Tax=Corynebacterium sp. TaxID=1720 RepID=UPI002A91751B|nr:6-phosphogluconolactonase [Corynebacterium sp.]MDY5784507.1 6-phosphogluconolactonase [Corynebacterium sp.]